MQCVTVHRLCPASSVPPTFICRVGADACHVLTAAVAAATSDWSTAHDVTQCTPVQLVPASAVKHVNVITGTLRGWCHMHDIPV